MSPPVGTFFPERCAANRDLQPVGLTGAHNRRSLDVDFDPLRFDFPVAAAGQERGPATARTAHHIFGFSQSSDSISLVPSLVIVRMPGLAGNSGWTIAVPMAYLDTPGRPYAAGPQPPVDVRTCARSAWFRRPLQGNSNPETSPGPASTGPWSIVNLESSGRQASNAGTSGLTAQGSPGF